MKNLVLSHKVVTGVLVGGLIYAAGVVAYASAQTEPVSHGSNTMSVVKPEPVAKKQKVAEDKPVSEPEPVTVQETIPEKVVIAPVVTEPVILSAQQYGEQYLELSKQPLQECFNIILSKYPDRFTPEVREANVKALRAWSSVCSTGVLTPNPIIDQFGPNGAFFDSDLAKKYH